ncbi:MAG TPA: SDR family NAD(P)-dependent oxidoreductase [Chlorobaculum sp.]|uniref:Oxidoreductase, short chain dehydrogenase/reductase family n=1 Tax=Chlorobaculum tepidum (strain ATCC 49652 / DSM 12025 / NBRC 103806 / TLS) TaxID=194439 RepID=Q8KBL5_CHLTE|nr:SDR family oxidoreductase [Chlorobaculum tepidum]AAM72992.1 oxidoreductase, short chain dehydrogenase/reductase family [Chlorobaculum tepidum TLS]HBU24438.1 SDR family NAD(P)-dependent oxidoreductase [Chlorobaculum sp.]
MKQLENRVAVITGSTKGIGRAIAREFVRQGAKVVITSSRQENVEAALREYPKDLVHGHVSDVSSYASVESLVDAAVRRFGALDCFINNAGISDPFTSVCDSDPAVWSRVIDTNLKGTYNGSRAAARYFLSVGRRGKIINMAGSGTDKGSNTPFISAYGSTKAAIARFTFAMAEEYRNAGLSIMLLHPGLVRTEINHPERTTPELQKQLKTFNIILDIFAQSPDLAVRYAVKMASSWSDGKTGLYLSALDGKRKKMMLLSYPFRKLFNRIDRQTY